MNSMDSNRPTGQDIRVHLIGGFGLLAVLVWLSGLLLLGYEAWAAGPVFGVAGRVGFMCLAIWLAFPGLKPLIQYRATLAWGAIGALVVMVAFSRTNRLLPLFLGLLTAATAAGWILSKTAKMLDND